MEDYIRQNKTAWEFDAYQFWVKQNGTPAQRAKLDMEDPKALIKKYTRYFDRYEGVRVANVCGSCGKKAVPLALLGAKLTVFDISEDNRRYACETAEAAGVKLGYVVGNVLEIDLNTWGEAFDVVFMEGGILHYFHDLEQFFRMMNSLLVPGGRMICSDFHPFNKITDALNHNSFNMGYFCEDIVETEMAHAPFYDEETRKTFPRCKTRRYTLSEILNGILSSGFILKRFDEHPSWINENLPGEFTAVAEKAES